MLLTDIRATELRPNDVWTSDKDDVKIESVASDLHDPMVRFTGRIIRGYGRGNKLRTWVVGVNQTLDVYREV
jgi:hypothetical protein